VFVEVFERVFTDIRNIVGDFFGAKFRITRFDLVFLNMNRGEFVLAQQRLTDQQCVFVIAAFPREECAQYIMTKR
jgi:hypothetical protein